ncbi:hypothetical protein [Pseudoalteromonas prydzensis]|uniref:Uncharacterized protein n=1 Tax=Pseudoalteromonas prydzensis TaxID=182141 RepID=A0ABR9FR46_9GAMM|nr:hypothetical protein [Pseudoalteromonas prydzensis]MBE0459302.1 hypothetical protein [Pseudoalteromonas prydzensis]
MKLNDYFWGSLSLNTQDYCDKDGNLFITQAYAMTVYSSQGLTIDGDSFVYYTTGMDRANTYVACSRQKDSSHIFLNSAEIKNKNESVLVSHYAESMKSTQESQLASNYLNRKNNAHSNLIKSF